MTNRIAMLMAGSLPALASIAFAAADIPLTNAPQGDTMYRPKDTNEAPIGYSGQQAVVHKAEAEGVLLIDAVSGWVLPREMHGPEGRPEWAEELGLSVAMLAERGAFYLQHTGKLPDHSEAYAFEDLQWLRVDPATEAEAVLKADDEFRMDALATLLGIDRETGEVKGADLVEHEIAANNLRSEEELEALDKAQSTASFEEYQQRSA